MRVLITRPAGEAAATAARLAALGHQAVIAPVMAIVPVETGLPATAFAAVIATSAAAFAGTALPATITGLPLLAVGEKTAAAARTAGFATVIAGPGTAIALAAQLAQGHARTTAPLLYLAGEPRKPDLEQALAAKAIPLVVSLRYRAEPLPDLAEEARNALVAGRLDVVLHYSRHAAERFAALVQAPPLRAPAQRLRHLCLSSDVAQGLAGLAPAAIAIASTPNETALFGQLDNSG